MLFNSLHFIGFFFVVLSLYYVLRNYRAQNAMLLVASYVFYGWWDWRFLGLIFASTLIDYLAAQQIEASTETRKRRLFLVISLIGNLGMLGFFKYYNFGIESLIEMLNFLGMQPNISTLQIILPVGISFYTFQSISYTVDVYRGERKPVKDLPTFALYVAFFPQLVAGPIEKSTHLLPQFQKPRRVGIDDLRIGFLWILTGYFFKVVIADSLAPMIDHAFASPDEVSGVISLVAVWAFAIQLYGDFAGYTLIARGTARLMGIELMHNFRAPYLARNPREFWARWHISLSSWLRQYLYISLGGSRNRSKLRTYANLVITMLLGGLWHGASWNFVLWGGYWGCVLVISHALGAQNRHMTDFNAVTVGKIIGTFMIWLGGLLLFRTTDLAHLQEVTSNIVNNFYVTDDLALYLQPTLLFFLVVIAYDLWLERTGDELALLKANRWLRLGIYAFMIVTIFVTGFRQTPFIYFQF